MRIINDAESVVFFNLITFENKIVPLGFVLFLLKASVHSSTLCLWLFLRTELHSPSLCQIHMLKINRVKYRAGAHKVIMRPYGWCLDLLALQFLQAERSHSPLVTSPLHTHPQVKDHPCTGKRRLLKNPKTALTQNRQYGHLGSHFLSSERFENKIPCICGILFFYIRPIGHT